MCDSLSSLDNLSGNKYRNQAAKRVVGVEIVKEYDMQVQLGLNFIEIMSIWSMGGEFYDNYKALWELTWNIFCLYLVNLYSCLVFLMDDPVFLFCFCFCLFL